VVCWFGSGVRVSASFQIFHSRMWVDDDNRTGKDYTICTANGTAVNKGMSFAISCCQPPNRSAISVTTLILLVSVGIVQFSVLMHFNTATPNSTNFASKLFYYVFFNL